MTIKITTIYYRIKISETYDRESRMWQQLEHVDSQRCRIVICSILMRWILIVTALICSLCPVDSFFMYLDVTNKQFTPQTVCYLFIKTILKCNFEVIRCVLESLQIILRKKNDFLQLVTGYGKNCC